MFANHIEMAYFALIACVVCLIFLLIGFRKKTVGIMPPSPMRIPIIGNLYNFFFKREPIFVIFRALAHQFGPVFTFWVGKVPLVVVSDYNAAKQVLYSNACSGRPQRAAGRLVSREFQGIIVTDACPALTVRRRLCKGAMRAQIGDNLEDILSVESKFLVSSIGEGMGERGKVVEMPQRIFLACCNTIWMLLFNERLTNGDKDYKMLMKMKKWWTEGLMFSSLSHSFPIIKALPVDKSSYLDYFKTACDNLVGTHFDAHRKQLNEDHTRDIMDKLLLHDSQLSRDNIEIIVSDLILGGTETVASTLEFVMLNLTKYKDIAEKCYEEIKNSVGYSAMTLADVSSLDYLNAVISETLRMTPPAPLGVPHKAIEDTSVGGYVIPKDTLLHVNIYAIHHDEALHREPQRFMPERFLNEEGRYRNIEGFLPFSAGRRQCIGIGLARKEVAFFAAELLRNYTLDVPKGQCLSDEVVFASTLSPKPYSVLMKKR